MSAKNIKTIRDICDSAEDLVDLIQHITKDRANTYTIIAEVRDLATTGYIEEILRAAETVNMLASEDEENAS